MHQGLVGFFTKVDTFFWGYGGFSLILLLGLYFTIKAKAFQIRTFPQIIRLFARLMKVRTQQDRGMHPLKVFFASVGGMVGIGNVVGIVTAVQIGGPGSLLWIWIAALVGSVIKYAEIFLGLKYRVRNERGGYDGGPMFFLQKAFKTSFFSIAICLLLCIYGVEIYQFSVISDSLASNFHLPKLPVVIGLLCLVLYAAWGGISRLGKICSVAMPFFMVAYILMSGYVVAHFASDLPYLIKEVASSAFTGHAAVGGFAGSSLLLTLQQGFARAAYSADIGIGYDSIIQSESATVFPQRQARLAILGVFFDNTICTLTVLLVLLTGMWKQIPQVAASRMVQEALSHFLPGMHLFMPFFLFIAGYTTIIAYFTVGMKCASYLAPKRGRIGYLLFGTGMLLTFSYFDQSHAMLLMSLSGSLLLIINLCGIFRLRHEVAFEIEEEEALASF